MAGSNELCGLTVITEICKKEHIRGNAEILKQLLAEFCETPVTNLIENADITPLGGGQFEISVIDDPREGYIAITEDLTFYEFDGSIWTLKFAGLGDFITSATDNGDDTYTFTSFDGSNSFTIPSSLAALGIFEEDSDFIVSDIYRNRYIISTAVESQTITIPSDTTENLEVGYAVTITSKNGECVKIVPEKGVTVNNEESDTNLISKGGKIKLVKGGPNEWGLYGDFKKVPIGYNRKRLVLTRSEVSTDTIYWLQVYKSSDWPKFNIQSDYFVLWSTDHATPAPNGEIRWGECDDPLLNNFVDRGRIVGGNQAETPWLMKVPVGESSFTNNEYFLFYHTDMSDPDNIPGFQETHLITTDGGDEPHLCTWTPTIKPLGNDGTENHTGYFTAFRRGPGDYVGTSVVCTPGVLPACAKLSTASDPASWTRGAEVPFVSNIDGSFGRAYSHYPVQYGGTTYGISRFLKNNGEQWVVLSELDNNFQPIRIVKYLFTHPQVRIFSIYEEAGNIYVLFKGGVDNSDVLNDYYSYVVKLSDVGNLRSSTINFDGVDGLLKSDNNTLFDLKFPIILRFTPTSVGDFDILGKGIRGASDNRWFVSYVAGEFGLTTRLLQSGPATEYRFPYVLNAGELYEYSAEIDPNTGDLVQYINGAEQRRDANPSISIVSTEFFLELGVVTGGSIVSYFQGSVDYLRIGEEEFDFTENYGYSTIGSQGHYLYLKGGVSWGSCTIQQRIELGDAYTDAFKGNLGKIAYEHSQLTSNNPHNVNIQQTYDEGSPASTYTPDNVLTTEAGVVKTTPILNYNVFNQNIRNSVNVVGTTETTILSPTTGSLSLTTNDCAAKNSYELEITGELTWGGTTTGVNVILYVGTQAETISIPLSGTGTEPIKIEAKLDFLDGVDTARTCIFTGNVIHIDDTGTTVYIPIPETELTVDVSSGTTFDATFTGTDAIDEITVSKAMLNRVIS